MVDYTDPDVFVNGAPHDLFAVLRRERPVAWQPPRGDHDGYWLVTKHQDVVFISKNTAAFTCTDGNLLAEPPPPEGRTGPWAMLANNITAQDPPKHTAARQIINPAFSVRAIARLEPMIRQEAASLLNHAIEKGACNFAEDIARALPMRIVLGELLGIPREDHGKFMKWSDALVAPEDRAMNPTRDTALRSLEALYAYGVALVRERRASPREDLISMLTQATTADGARLTDDNIMEYWFPLILGGVDTMASTSAAGALTMIEHPDQWQRLRAEPSLVPTAVDEVLRWVPPVLYFRRTATADIELRGQQIRRGQRVILCYPSANRDEDVFRASSTFDIARSPNQHISFGFGPHVCLGARIAQMMLRILFDEMRARLLGFEVVGAVRRVRSAWINRIHSLPVELKPASSGMKSQPARPASVSHGPPLREEATAISLQQALARAADRSQEKGVVYVREDGTELVQHYPALLREAGRVLAGLQNLGLVPQDRVVLCLDRNDEFIVAFWGCVLGGLVPVPISIPPGHDPASISKKLHPVLQRLERAVVLTTRAIAAAMRSATGPAALPLRIVELDTLQAHEAAGRIHASRPEDLALLLLTSGSTGMPKGVMLSHANILSMIRGIAQMYGISDQDTLLNWIPVDHVGGIAFIHLMGVYLGSKQVLLQKEFILHDPLAWIDAMARHRAAVTLAPNFAFALANARAEEIGRRRWDLSSMRVLGNGGEAIVPRTARRTLELLRQHGLPASAMRPMWGMSETASAAVVSDRFSLETTSDDDAFAEIGPPIPGLSIRIVNDDGVVVPEGTTGHLEVRGHSVTSGYLPSLSSEHEAFTPDGWYKTGDCGFLRDGRLTMTGRSKDIIIIHGNNHWAYTIEAVVAVVRGVEASCVAAGGVRRPSSETDEIVIFFSPSSPDGEGLADLIREIRRAVARDIGVPPLAVVPLAKAAIPRTDIGKIQRAQLVRRFEAGEFDGILERLKGPSQSADAEGQALAEPRTELEKALAAAWRDVLQVEEVGVHDDFFDLGGSSVLLVQLQQGIQNLSGRDISLRETLEYPTIAAMASYLGGAA